MKEGKTWNMKDKRLRAQQVQKEQERDDKVVLVKIKVAERNYKIER